VGRLLQAEWHEILLESLDALADWLNQNGTVVRRQRETEETVSGGIKVASPSSVPAPYQDASKKRDAGRPTKTPEDLTGRKSAEEITVVRPRPITPKSLAEIAERAANLQAPDSHGGASSPSRADLVVEWMENTPAIRDCLARAEVQGYRQLNLQVAAIRERAERGDRDLKLGDRVLYGGS
jgi:hypothetical protein